jgi:5-methylcytosine-specific restriction endonuclease McrA
MAFEIDQLNWIFARTSGLCHICRKSLCRNNYGRLRARGSWQVEHSVPKSKGGTDHLNNLFPACCDCNLKKSNRTTRTARGWHENTKAPLSTAAREKARGENTFLGGFLVQLRD